MSSSEHEDDDLLAGGGTDPDDAGDGAAAPRPGRRRRLTVAVAVAAVLAAGGGTYWAVAAGGDGGGSTAHAPVERATGGAQSKGSTGAGDTGSSSGVITAPAGTYRLTGTLPEKAPASAALYRAKGGPDKAAVQRLAAALGLSGAVVDEGGSWRVGPADGSGHALLVGKDAPGTWSYTVGGQVMSPGARTVVPPALPKVPPPAKGDGADGNSSSTARSGSSGASTAHSATGDPATPPVSPDRAKAVAAPVLAELGLSGAAVDASMTAGSSRTVTADPVVGGLPTHGWQTSVVVGADGSIGSGYGRLSPLDKGETRAVISAQQAFAQLTPPRMMHPGAMCAAPVPNAADGGAASSGPGAGSAAPADPGDGTAAATPAPCSAPFTPPAAQPVDVTGARFGLAVQYVTGGQALVPAWLFDAHREGSAAAYVVPQPAVDLAGLGGGASAAPPVPVQPPSTGDPDHTAVAGYQAQGSTLTLIFWGGVCETYHGSAAETSTTVKVTVTQTRKDKDAVCPAILKSQSVTVQLKSPLGTRTVTDTTSGRTLTAS
ncbi:hypothetical protein [Actinacidiphila epipremni]|uniref:Large membrane protein n=1 Tax=Actinacidiphila epipremni TaxID=2053013 RepID=A0ABX0ZTH3_9ACTN|nr:hypothetical protein [Actinacidiphila epipremni]NJP44923.1 hypothetical protein [Actinacidiphila epipremni]